MIRAGQQVPSLSMAASQPHTGINRPWLNRSMSGPPAKRSQASALQPTTAEHPRGLRAEFLERSPLTSRGLLQPPFHIGSTRFPLKAILFFLRVGHEVSLTQGPDALLAF